MDLEAIIMSEVTGHRKTNVTCFLLFLGFSFDSFFIENTHRERGQGDGLAKARRGSSDTVVQRGEWGIMEQKGLNWGGRWGQGSRGLHEG